MGLFEYVKDLPEHVILQLYGDKDISANSQWACRAVFQSLTPLSRNVVMRIIFVDDFTLTDIAGWVHMKDKHALDKAIEELLGLHIIVKSRSSTRACALDEGFRRSLLESLSNSVEPWSDLPCDQDDVNSRPNVIDLENRCITKWNTTLEYLVTSSGDINITQSMKLFLLQAGLMQQLDTESLASAGGNKVGLRITSKGYEYMLLDTRQQVWLFALECLKCVAAADLAEVISFLFMLSYCKVGECYPVSALSSAQIKFMSQLCDLGIIFRTHFKATVFYPTRIAVSMSCTAEQAQASVPLVTAVSAASRGTVAVKEAGSSVLAMHIIVETNFQVVAYVKSDLHLHMLRLFVDSHGMIRMPDMAVGHLTRRSIKAALRTGISAAQIISFLEVHAHPLVATRVPIVPENVTDQLFLWEAENVRLKVDDGVCVNLTEIASGEYLDFLFSKLEEYANEIGVCLWSSAAKKSLIITPEGYNQLNLFAETLDAGG